MSVFIHWHFTRAWQQHTAFSQVFGQNGLAFQYHTKDNCSQSDPSPFASSVPEHRAKLSSRPVGCSCSYGALRKRLLALYSKFNSALVLFAHTDSQTECLQYCT